ncbi:hypothetical protein [Pseudomonas plecoglossicida]|uniref:hypothetical protein n=1 Tax=Pseudomonas plecoglossicida TaxID=70775 RepID=UPI00051DCE92|nr:hypothetical protein [Pseudomonas plecoglossicida]KGK24280.1 hypothetical protein GT93_05235 [Pseudomonas plecoglossicida]
MNFQIALADPLGDLIHDMQQQIDANRFDILMSLDAEMQLVRQMQADAEHIVNDALCKARQQ